MIDRAIAESCFTTSYHNFISDHNAIVIRVGLNGNPFTEKFKERITFDRESHLKKKIQEKNLPQSIISSNSSENDDSTDASVSGSSEAEVEADASVSGSSEVEVEADASVSGSSEAEVEGQMMEIYIRKFSNSNKLLVELLSSIDFNSS